MEEAATDDVLAPGARIGDHFIVARKLGGGGMGDVYLAENQLLPGKKYAIKVLKRELSSSRRFIELLRQEAQKQAKFTHDNVVSVYDLIVSGDYYCLIQDFIPGKSLASLIEEHPGGLELSVVLPFMIGILDGLDYAHSIGILHCDVKPANVLIDENGRPRVTDFGISRDIGSSGGDGGVAGAGTAEYMAPEQALPPYAIDHRADVFSAGVLFFEALCGQLPFEAPSGDSALSLPQVHRDAPDVREMRADIPAPIARIVATALQRDPAARFAGCSDFRHAIDRYSRAVLRRRFLVRAVPIALVLAIAGGAVLYKWREGVRLRAMEAERINVREVLDNAVASRNLLCREWIEYQIKQAGLARARDDGFPDLVSKFQEKLAGMQLNMNRHVTTYVSSMRQLQSDDPAIVAQALDALPSANPDAKRLVDSMKADNASLRAGGPIASKDDLLSRCPPPLKAP